MKRFLILLALISSTVIADAQQKGAEPVAFWGKEDAYLLKQASHMFSLVDQALTENPPVVGAPMARKLALYNLDAMLHEVKYDNTEPFCNFIDSRIGKVIEDMKSPVKRGVKIYKIYNDGFVVRTKSANIAFDVVRGACKKQQLLSDEQVDAIVDKCDVLFLSHNHGDHVDKYVVNRFIESGKPVIAASEILPNLEGVTHYRSESEILDKVVKLKSGEELQVKIFPGHQSPMMCNIYVVTTPDKYTVAHTGDQYDKNDMEWIAEIKDKAPKIDALMINCWSYQIADAIKGFDPRYVLSSHENEMGHTIDHREAFWLTFQKLEPVQHDYVVMSWGEWFSFK
ncbi:MAG: MBL fold metallo-hydrolase [Alistipes sp.]|nr:MBL fold metallo-hydrolase [Alistipes sp.]